jgi:toxin-antitoxin system PIN domain toxin
VLVALAWPAHVHHAIAHRWFGRSRKHGWATCPVTQAGFVRVLSNPSFSPDALTPREALAQLREMTALPGHIFFLDDVSLVGSKFLAPEKLQGYRQVSDAHLLSVALRNRGVFATLDRGARSLVPKGFAPDVVEFIGEGADP